jgi:hypothetical protein
VSATWKAVYRANPTDPRPITFWFDDGELTCSEALMLRAVERLAEGQGTVWATPTGPSAPADLSISHVAFSLVRDMGLLAGLTSEQIEVSGDEWQWPVLRPMFSDAVY